VTTLLRTECAICGWNTACEQDGEAYICADRDMCAILQELNRTRRERDTALAAETYWKLRHADAWTLIGRLDYALEQIKVAKELRGARRWAVKMRAEIKGKVTP
jgi:hypothetical protein